MADGAMEQVAGLLKDGSNNYTSVVYTADSRYRNEYTTTSSEYHKGDAMYQNAGWYNGPTRYVSSNYPVFWRSYYGLMGFFTGDGYGIYTRAVVVCGEGL